MIVFIKQTPSMDGSTEGNLKHYYTYKKSMSKLYWTRMRLTKKVNVLVIKLKDICDIKKGKCVI